MLMHELSCSHYSSRGLIHKRCGEKYASYIRRHTRGACEPPKPKEYKFALSDSRAPHESSRQRAWMASVGIGPATLSSSSGCGGTERTPSRYA